MLVVKAKSTVIAKATTSIFNEKYKHIKSNICGIWSINWYHNHLSTENASSSAKKRAFIQIQTALKRQSLIWLEFFAFTKYKSDISGTLAAAAESDDSIRNRQPQPRSMRDVRKLFCTAAQN